MKAYALTQTESQSRLGILWITSIVMDATSAPLTDKDRRPGGEKSKLYLKRAHKQVCALMRTFAHRSCFCWMDIRTNDGIQGEGTLSEDLLVARHR